MGYNNTGLVESSDWTVDFWVNYSSSIVGDMVGGICSEFGKYPEYTWCLFYSYLTNTLTIYKGFNWSSGAGEEKASISFSFPENQWSHFAVEKHNNTINGYVNGQLVISYTNNEVINAGNCSLGAVYERMDELRFSAIARYKGQPFTPPTEAYRVAEPTGNYMVNFTGKADGSNASFPLFYHTFTDHILNDASWLRSDTFSWQSGDVYVSAYNHLVEEFEGLTAETETVDSTEITFYRAEDGHKIVLADQEDNVSAIYAETGVAWYYILDTENKRFKLPRDGNRFRLEANKELLDWDKQETISNGFVAPSSGFVVVGVQANDNNYYAYVTPKGGTQVSVYGGYNNDAGGQWSFIVNEGDTFSASAFNNGIFVPFLPSVKGVEEDNKKYLYFYVGNTILNQTEVDMGAVTEQLNSKADVDLGNVTDEGKETAISWVMPDYENGIEITNIAANVFVQVEKDSFVVVFGSDPYAEDYYAYVSPDGGTTKYIVGRRTDDTGSNTQTISFPFFVPAGWYFSNGAENGGRAFIYPLIGVKK